VKRSTCRRSNHADPARERRQLSFQGLVEKAFLLQLRLYLLERYELCTLADRLERFDLQLIFAECIVCRDASASANLQTVRRLK
jgi:hypothetical protein